MLAALAGGAAMMGRGKGTAFPRPKAGTIDQMAADAAGPVTGVTNPNEAIAKAKEAAAASSGNPYLSRMSGAGDALANQRKRAAYALSQRAPKNVMGPQSYMQPNVVRPGGRLNIKKGGRVTGIAKRGFGRALMKGKK